MTRTYSQLEVFITKKFIQCEMWHTLKTGLFESPDKKKTRKLFSKCELLFLDQAIFRSNPYQILIKQYPIPRAFLLPLQSLSSFTLANWNPSSTQSSQLLDIPNHMPSQPNFLLSYLQIIILYWSNTLTIKKPSL